MKRNGMRIYPKLYVWSVFIYLWNVWWNPIVFMHWHFDITHRHTDAIMLRFRAPRHYQQQQENWREWQNRPSEKREMYAQNECVVFSYSLAYLVIHLGLIILKRILWNWMKICFSSVETLKMVILKCRRISMTVCCSVRWENSTSRDCNKTEIE